MRDRYVNVKMNRSVCTSTYTAEHASQLYVGA